MKKANSQIVTPFDWQRYTAAEAASGRTDRPASPAVSRAKKLSVKDRVERIMASRWGNPYSKPGAA